jgi:hypothetical protein
MILLNYFYCDIIAKFMITLPFTFYPSGSLIAHGGNPQDRVSSPFTYPHTLISA